jgi:hypothetical protein
VSQEVRRKVGQPRKYSLEFRREALERMAKCDNITQLARELGIRRKFLYKWREEARGPQPESAAEVPVAKLRERIAELERLVGQQAAENDFFKGALRRIKERRQQSASSGGAASTTRSGS